LIQPRGRIAGNGRYKFPFPATATQKENKGQLYTNIPHSTRGKAEDKTKTSKVKKEN
jgi:hypothetical protein